MTYCGVILSHSVCCYDCHNVESSYIITLDNNTCFKAHNNYNMFKTQYKMIL